MSCARRVWQRVRRSRRRRYVVHGTLRADADVGFTTCRRGHRIVMRRVRLKVAV